MGQHNIIELNGKQYDASTGALLGESRVIATPARAAAQAHRGRAIDGFVRNKPTGLAPTVIKPTISAKPAVVQPLKKTASGSKPDIRRAPKVIRAHQPERPKTLMRHAVSKPKATMKPAIKTTAPAEMIARPVSALAKPLEKKLSVSQVNPYRMARAKHVAKSHHIHRFQHVRQQQGVVAATLRPVVQQAAHPAAHAQHPTPARKVSHSIALAKAKQQLAARQSSVDIFEAALAHAVSHEQMPIHAKRRRRPSKRIVNIFAGVAAFLVIGGFITYLNLPAIELQVASVRAGFHAEMPSYHPTGYALDGGVQSSRGKVAMKFRSGDSSFKITQEASDWNSATLLDQKAEERGAPAQTVQSKGRIIYLYDDSTATWVNGGVRYEISGNAALDTDELVSLATSM